MNALGPLWFAILSFLPGAWLAYGLPLDGVPLRARAYLALVVSPVVVVAEYYSVRLTGAPFHATAIALLIGNLPAGVLVYRRWKGEPAGQGSWSLPFVAACTIPAILLGLKWSDWQISAISAHTFLHSDVIYSLANGFLKVEEAQLAGITLGYPWGGHVHQAVVSWAWGAAPVVTFQVTNLVLLLATCALIAEVAVKLGGSGLSRAMAVISLLFAVNAVGAVFQFVLPDELLARFPVWGDERYTPWLRKYIFWSQHPAAHALFAGMLYMLAGPRREPLRTSSLALLAAMFAGLAVIYPVVMPAALALLAARFMVEVTAPAGARYVAGSLVRLGTVGVVAAAATVAMVLLISQNRAGTGLGISSGYELRIKSVESMIVLAPLLAGAGYYAFVRLKELPERAGVLLLGAAGSVVLFVLFAIPPGRNEYKFMFAAAMCLAPLAAVALDALIARGGALRVSGAIAFLVFLGATGVAPFLGAHHPDPPLRLSAGDFRVRLAEDHPQAASLASVAARTPVRTIVMVDSSAVHVPVFASRAMYAPALMNTTHWGVGLKTKDLLESVRGYGPEIIARRMEVARRLFQSQDAADRLAALRDVEAMGRPVALLLEQPRQERLTKTLTDSGAGTIIHRDPRWVVWLWTPGASANREE